MKNKKTIGQMLTWFILAVALIAIYKVLDNFSEITNWIKNLVSILMPFLMGVLVAYLFYVPVKKVENLYKKTKVLNKRARKLSVLTVYLMALLVIVILINVVLPAVSKSVVELTLKDGYRNMAEYIKKDPRSVIAATNAMKRLGIETITSPIRGGTDGAKLTLMGLNTPNLGTGGYNCHGPYEFDCLEEMEIVTKILVEIAKA